MFSWPLFILLCVTAFLFSWLATRYKKTALVILILVMITLPFFANTSDWTHWFAWVKRYTILISTLLLIITTLVVKKYEHTKIATSCLVVIFILLFINMIEVGLYDFGEGNQVNGILCILLGFLIPIHWGLDGKKNVIGFNSALWVITHTTLLSYTYLFNTDFQDFSLYALVAIWLPLLGILLQKDWCYWLMYRILILYFVIVLDSVYPSISTRYFYPAFLHPAGKMALNASIYPQLLLTLNIILVALLLGQRIMMIWKKVKPKN